MKGGDNMKFLKIFYDFIKRALYCLFILVSCLIFSQTLEEKIHQLKMSNKGYYLTGDYVVIDLNMFECNFIQHKCSRK